RDGGQYFTIMDKLNNTQKTAFQEHPAGGDVILQSKLQQRGISMRVVPIHFAVFTGLALAIPAGAVTKSAGDFLSYAIKSDNSDIQLGQLVEQKAENPKVRDLGRAGPADHPKKEVASQAAGTTGTAPPNEPSQEGQQEYTKLSGLSGKAFDDEFLRYM